MWIARARLKCLNRLSVAFSAACFGHLHGQIQWQGPNYFIATKGAPVKQILQDLGGQYGVSILVSGAVDDVFVGRLDPQSPERAFQKLCQLYGLITYEEGNRLHVYRSEEMESAVFAPKAIPIAKLVQYLKDSDAVDLKNSQINYTEGFEAFEVFGVPACINRIEKLVNDLDEKEELAAQTQEVIQIFPLQYALAEDTTYHYRNQEILVPGVATLLRNLETIGTFDGKAESAILSSEVGSFYADPRTNSVVVRDKKVRLPMYEKVIAQLDIKPTQVEIAVSIIDIDAHDFTDFGINKLAAQLSPFGVKLDLNYQSSAQSRHGEGLSAFVGDSQQFMLAMHVLESNAQARIISQPSVLTLSNMQAILDKSTTFYTKLEAARDPKLEAITSGTVLKVTPRVIGDTEMDQEVLLQVHLQDGQQTNLQGSRENAEALPQVHNSEVITQAHLRPGQGLLLGGFVKEQEAERSSGIPFFSQIPLVGHLFKSTHYSQQRVIRLFFLRATPLTLDTRMQLNFEEDLSPTYPTDWIEPPRLDYAVETNGREWVEQANRVRGAMDPHTSLNLPDEATSAPSLSVLSDIGAASHHAQESWVVREPPTAESDAASTQTAAGSESEAPVSRAQSDGERSDVDMTVSPVSESIGPHTSLSLPEADPTSPSLSVLSDISDASHHAQESGVVPEPPTAESDAASTQTAAGSESEAPVSRAQSDGKRSDVDMTVSPVSESIDPHTSLSLPDADPTSLSLPDADPTSPSLSVLSDISDASHHAQESWVVREPPTAESHAASTQPAAGSESEAPVSRAQSDGERPDVDMIASQVTQAALAESSELEGPDCLNNVTSFAPPVCLNQVEVGLWTTDALEADQPYLSWLAEEATLSGMQADTETAPCPVENKIQVEEQCSELSLLKVQARLESVEVLPGSEPLPELLSLTKDVEVLAVPDWFEDAT